MIFRFDDISGNTDMNSANEMAQILRGRFNAQIWYCISPLYDANESKTGRVYPSEWNPYSNYQIYFRMSAALIPQCPACVEKVSHGLIHVDHRLLTFEQQEMSIVMARYLTGSLKFVPPFHKWDADTEEVCEKNNIELIKYEDQWLGAEHNTFNTECEKWYIHPRNWTKERLLQWITTTLN